MSNISHTNDHFVFVSNKIMFGVNSSNADVNFVYNTENGSIYLLLLLYLWLNPHHKSGLLLINRMILQEL